MNQNQSASAMCLLFGLTVLAPAPSMAQCIGMANCTATAVAMTRKVCTHMVGADGSSSQFISLTSPAPTAPATLCNLTPMSPAVSQVVTFRAYVPYGGANTNAACSFMFNELNFLGGPFARTCVINLTDGLPVELLEFEIVDKALE